MSDDIFSCSCPGCGSDLSIPAEFCGKEVECPECSFSFTVEEPAVENSTSTDNDGLLDMSSSATRIDPECMEEVKDMSNRSDQLDPSEKDTNLETPNNTLDLSDGATHVEDTEGEIDEEGQIDEDELIDLSEGDTEPPYKKTSSAVINLTETETGKIEPQNEMHCSTVKIQRKSIGMVPDCKDKDSKFTPIESTKALDLEEDEIRKALKSKKRWWKFW